MRPLKFAGRRFGQSYEVRLPLGGVLAHPPGAGKTRIVSALLAQLREGGGDGGGLGGGDGSGGDSDGRCGAESDSSEGGGEEESEEEGEDAARRGAEAPTPPSVSSAAAATLLLCPAHLLPFWKGELQRCGISATTHLPAEVEAEAGRWGESGGGGGGGGGGGEGGGGQDPGPQSEA